MKRIDLKTTSPSTLKWMWAYGSSNSLVRDLKNLLYSSSSISDLSLSQMAFWLLTSSHSQVFSLIVLVFLGFSYLSSSETSKSSFFSSPSSPSGFSVGSSSSSTSLVTSFCTLK